MAITINKLPKYELIYADPAWQYKDAAKAGNRGAEQQYDVMPLGELQAMRVDRIAADNCLLAMWWTGPLAFEALSVMTHWGFELINMTGFTWHKTTKTGKDHFGMGHYTRGNCENVLFAKRGRPKRVNAGVRQIIHAQSREHSRKPNEVREALETLMGDVPRVELFARGAVEGWDVWGNEAEGSKNLQLMANP